MSLFSPLMVICLDRDQAPAFEALATGLGFPDAHIVDAGFEAAGQALAKRASSPEYLLIDIGARTADVLPALDAFAHQCEAYVRVVITGQLNDIEFYRELKQRGVLEYFAHPLDASAIRDVLIRPSQKSAPATPPQVNGTVISCMSAASGDGSSTVALNLAYCLATEFKQSTVLVDMDYQFGLISKSLDLAAPFGIREVFDHPERGLDALLVSKMLVNYKGQLEIISAPGELRLMPTIRPESVRELIHILRARFRFVIIDVPHIWTDWTAATLSYSDHVIMVGQLWLRSLTHASRLLVAWQSIGVHSDTISMVINRSGAKFKEAITTQDYERICRRPIDAHINNDVKAITHAENHAHTLFEGELNSVLRQQISDIARRLVTRYAGKAAAIAASGADHRKGWIAFAVKRRGGS